MANPHNGHDTLADESWLQALLSDNNTGLLADIIATITDERGIESHCRRSGHTEKTPWSVEEVLKLIVGVLSTTPKPGRQKRWKEIVGKYFKGERTEEKLKQKWKDLKKHATKKTDGEQRLFYFMVAVVEYELKSDKRGVFEKVMQEWLVSPEGKNQGIEAWTWLKKVENLELKEQLEVIKDFVTAEEQRHAYDKICYWRNPSLMN